MSLNLLEFELMLLFLVSLIRIFKGWRFRLLCLSLLNDNCNRCARTCLHYFRYCLDFTCFIFLSFATHFTWLFLRFKFNKLYDNNILKSFLLMWLFHLKSPNSKCSTSFILIVSLPFVNIETAYYKSTSFIFIISVLFLSKMKSGQLSQQLIHRFISIAAYL